jgi:4-amino-4-deoxy-L-arabinose transferase-like glycosyltransferase
MNSPSVLVENLPQPTTRRLLPGRMLAIILLVWLSLLVWANTIPIDDHEAYVLQTTREMAVTGDWIVPYFNEEPRLNKPPLNYWLTLGISRVDPLGTDVEPWHGRMVSLFGGLFLLLLTAYTGSRLYGDRVGFLAAVLLIGTKGFTDFSLNARPDFLYTTFCVAQLFAWVASWRAGDNTPAQRLGAGLGWLCAALATLTKGPQVPAIFLLGFLLFLLCDGERHRVLKILRPFSGLALALALCLPWWFLLQNRLEGLAVDLGKTQLSGSLLMMLSDWKEILSLYYLKRLAILLLPASLTLPLLLYLNRKQWCRPGKSARLLLYVGMIMLIIFTVAGHYRSHYMLPLLPPAALLIGVAATRAATDGLPEKLWRWLFGLGTLTVAIWPVLLISRQQFVAGLLLAGIGGGLIVLLRAELRASHWQTHPFAAKVLTCSLLAVLLLPGINTLPIQDRGRTVEREFSLAVGERLRSEDILVALDNSYPAGILPYYVNHHVTIISALEELGGHFNRAGAGRNCYLIVSRASLALAEEGFHRDALLTAPSEQVPGKEMIFAKVVEVRR